MKCRFPPQIGTDFTMIISVRVWGSSDPINWSWEWKSVSPLLKITWQNMSTLQMGTAHNPKFHFSVYTPEKHLHKETLGGMFVAALLMVVKYWPPRDVHQWEEAELTCPIHTVRRICSDLGHRTGGQVKRTTWTQWKYSIIYFHFYVLKGGSNT